MIGFVYSIIRRDSGKTYIGATIRDAVESRWSEHISAMQNGSLLPIHCALRKYGINAFDFAIIWSGAFAHVIEKEIYYIADRCSLVPRGYNLTYGGDGLMCTPEAREYLSVLSDRKYSEIIVLPVYSSGTHKNYMEWLSMTCNRARRCKQVCVLTQCEITALICWGIVPRCAHHRHSTHAKIAHKRYKYVKLPDGANSNLVTPISAFELNGVVSTDAARRMPHNAFSTRVQKAKHT
jgi:hypothetical protein